ncbi:hypothetical protein GOP47_0016694 [Adiantum capillus-veneris]|uniref:Uncharacterized protein n=1 Tax=Adiantum capillus-veneris TaxID=13818 RepID=A0A9D4ZAY9_ADICA|nr:hypothetical protein GOP47_0016694 [Adiantum capillus-veneris]
MACASIALPACPCMAQLCRPCMPVHARSFGDIAWYGCGLWQPCMPLYARDFWQPLMFLILEGLQI